MDNSAPFEIIASGEVEVWVAPLATTKPDVDEVPSVVDAAWVKVGTSGNLNYAPDGITVKHAQSIEKFRALGDTGTRKVARTEEDLMVGVTVWDLTLEQYRRALNDNAITTTAQGAGQPGKKKVGLSRGSAVATMSVLLRMPSPYMDDGVMQYYIPRAAQTGDPEVAFKNDEPAGLELEWTALVDPNAASADERFGYIEAQTSAAA